MVVVSVGQISDSNGLLEEQKVTLSRLWAALENVCDPEVPVLSVLDLGVVRSVTLRQDGAELTSNIESKQQYTIVPTQESSLVIVQITPTYTGCPAIGMMAANIQIELLAHGFDNVRVVEVLSPAWTTDWMSEAGKQKLLAYGIAPPQNKARIEKMVFADTSVACPQCGSENTTCISEFGSTACKSLFRCLDCREPFDYFKCH